MIFSSLITRINCPTPDNHFANNTSTLFEPDIFKLKQFFLYFEPSVSCSSIKNVFVSDLSQRSCNCCSRSLMSRIKLSLSSTVTVSAHQFCFCHVLSATVAATFKIFFNFPTLSYFWSKMAAISLDRLIAQSFYLLKYCNCLFHF